MDKFIIILLTGFLEFHCVKIDNLQVPPLATLGVPVILDCDYSLDFPKDEGLVVKWFFNENLYPVYQWIPESKPQELGILKGRLDLSYRASEEKHKVHRALKIVKLGPELSGNFTCLVSTFSSEDSQTKKMLVFVAEKNLQLKHPSNQNEPISTVVCYVEDVYPKPDLKLYLNNSEIENTTFTIRITDNGLFSIQMEAVVDNLVDGTEIICELHVTEANYTVRKEAIYYKAESTYNLGISLKIESSIFLHIYFILLYMIL